MLININAIHQLTNARAVMRTKNLASLMASLRTKGQIHPVGVHKLGDGKYGAIWGNRRIAAAKKLGWTDIKAEVYPNLSPVEVAVLGLVENLERDDITTGDKGIEYNSLIFDHGLTEEEVAARVGVPLRDVKLARQVAAIVPEGATVRDRPKAGEISKTAARMIMNARRDHNLNAKQMKLLWEHAKTQKKTSAQHWQAVAIGLNANKTVKQAISDAKKLRRVTIQFMFSDARIRALELKHGMSINQLISKKIRADLGAT